MRPIICPHCNTEVPIFLFHGTWHLHAICPQCNRLLLEKNKQIARTLFWGFALVLSIVQIRLVSFFNAYYHLSIGEKCLLFLLLLTVVIISTYGLNYIIYHLFCERPHKKTND